MLVVHQVGDYGWEEVESFTSMSEVTNEVDLDMFEWLMVQGESVVIQGHTMWEIR